MIDRLWIEHCRGITAIAVCIFAWVWIVAVDHIHPGVPYNLASYRTYAAVDWAGHILTALVFAMGLWAFRLPIPIWTVLIGGVVLDLGHLLTFADLAGEVDGSSRNGSHSLLIVVLIALIGFCWDQRHANWWLGIAIGALTHLLRDMGTGTVPLFWPFTDVVYGTSFNRYLAITLGASLALIGSSILLNIHEKANSVTCDE